MPPFAARLTAAVQQRRTPLVVGLDPHWQLLPAELTRGVALSDRPRVLQTIESFCQSVLEVIAPLVPAIKPQWAFFEEWGSGGLRILEDLIVRARSLGLLVIADAKRGDIGSTAAAYANAFFGQPDGGSPSQDFPLSDALTVNPYLGIDTLGPFIQRARAVAAGLFVLVKTSNPGSGDFQDLRTREGDCVFEVVARHVTDLARQSSGGSGYGDVGAVVGATYPEQLIRLRRQLPHSWILVPGFGAQGGAAADVAGAFDSQGLGALINSSRAILFAQRQPAYQHVGDWQRAIEQACLDSIAALRSETPAGQL